MPEKNEKNVQDAIVRWLKKQNLWHMKVHGGPYQRAGIPDLLIIFHGEVIWIEVKATGKKPSKLQTVIMQELLDQKCFVNWLDDSRRATDWLRAVTDEIRDRHVD